MVIIASTLGYVLSSLAFNPRSNYEGGNPPIPESTIIAKLNHLGVNPDVPIVKRYATWVGNVVTGDFGLTVGEKSVNEEFSRRIWVSLRLLLLGSVLGSVLGVALGVFSAVRQYGIGDRASSVASFVFLSMPVFLVAILLKYGAISFNQKIGTTFFYTIGESSADFSGGSLELFVNRLQHLMLPTLSITLGGIAFYSRYQRNAMLDVLGSDFIQPLQPIIICFCLEFLCLGQNRDNSVAIQDSVKKRNHTMLRGQEMNRPFLQIAQPSRKQFRRIDRR
jgi:peptide/nickel transport system permease protein